MKTYKVTITSCGREFCYDITTYLGKEEVENRARIEAERLFYCVDEVRAEQEA